MNMFLTRKEKREDGIFGELCDQNGERIFFTLEHAYGTKDGMAFYPKVPVGQYVCERGIHRLKEGPDFMTFEIMSVPDCTGILFHMGNFNSNSEGCVLLGMAKIAYLPRKQMVTHSRKAFGNFMELQSSVNSFKLNVVDHC